MSDRKRDTEFLKWLIGFGDADKCETLRCQFLQLEREDYCLRRTMTLMSVLTLIALCGLFYAVHFVPHWYGRSMPWLVRMCCALGLSATVSLLVAWACWFRQRLKINALRNDCREFIRTSLLLRVNLSEQAPQDAIVSKEADPVELRSVSAS